MGQEIDNDQNESSNSNSDSHHTQTVACSNFCNLIRRGLSELYSWVFSIIPRKKQQNEENGPDDALYQYEAVMVDTYSKTRSSSSFLNSSTTKSDSQTSSDCSFSNVATMGRFYPDFTYTELADKRNVEITYTFQIPKQFLMKLNQIELKMRVAAEVYPNSRGCFFLFLCCEMDGEAVLNDIKPKVINAASIVQKSFSTASNVIFFLTDEIKEVMELKEFKKAKGLRLTTSIRRRKVINPTTSVEACEMAHHFSGYLLVTWN